MFSSRMCYSKGVESSSSIWGLYLNIPRFGRKYVVVVGPTVTFVVRLIWRFRNDRQTVLIIVLNLHIKELVWAFVMSKCINISVLPT